MYLTLKETAEYLSMPEGYIESLIQQKKIKAFYDGVQFMINKDQFNHHMEQVEKLKHQLEEWKREPLPEDPDIKDED